MHDQESRDYAGVYASEDLASSMGVNEAGDVKARPSLVPYSALYSVSTCVVLAKQSPASELEEVLEPRRRTRRNGGVRRKALFAEGRGFPSYLSCTSRVARGGSGLQAGQRWAMRKRRRRYHGFDELTSYNGRCYVFLVLLVARTTV